MMNKTVIFVTFACLGGLALAGAVVVLLFKPEAFATLTSLIVTVLGIVASAAGTFYALGKQGEKLEEIGKQTNGTLTKRDAKIAEQEAELIELRAWVAKTGAPAHAEVTD